MGRSGCEAVVLHRVGRFFFVKSEKTRISVGRVPTTRAVGEMEPSASRCFEEIKRRHAVADGIDEIPSEETAGDFDSSAALTGVGGAHVLLTLGSAVLAPRSSDATRPSMRVYGSFDTAEDALDHASVVRELDADCSLIVASMGEWILVPQEEASLDPDERERRVKKRLRSFHEERCSANAAFKEMVKNHVNPYEDKEEAMDMDELVESAHDGSRRPPGRLRAGAEVRGQTAAAVCIVADPERGECLVKILGCFETSDEATRWVDEVAMKMITAFDIVVMPLCEWVYPNCGTAKARKTLYRNAELQRIMDYAAGSQNPVSYGEWKQNQSAGTA